ncbi:insulinase family protein [Catellatospora methionotrophica]|uniref:insulinase family protein n=1 Tax=Catellatospora methionotrophica TaxID=121620 RepID=UPI00340BE807
MTIHTTQVGQIPALFAPRTGPTRAGLVFRVGRADETLATAGITHLVEHLALHRQGLADYHFNGGTGLTATMFSMEGTPSDVVRFLNGVCASLRELPLDRLDIERKILETEAAGRGQSLSEPLLLWRHGARGAGLAAYPEWGVPALTGDQLSAWAATWFTSGNAAVWISGARVPEGLELDLPDGPRRPLPAEPSALPVTPAYFTGPTGVVAMDARLRRSTAAGLYARALDRALFRQMRQEGGLSYTAAATYDTGGGTRAKVTAVVDGQPDRQHEVIGGFVRVVKELAAQPVSEAEFASLRTMTEEALRHAELDAMRLPQSAIDLLTDAPVEPVEALAEQLAKVTAEDVRDEAAAALGTALVMAPEGHALERYGFEQAPGRSRFAVTGSRHRSHDLHRTTLIIAPDGVSITTPQGPLTVLHEATSAVLAWPDGARQLIGHDAISLRVEPALFADSRRALAAIDAAVDPALVVRLPARDPADVPKRSWLRGARTRLRWARQRVQAALHPFAARRNGYASLLLTVVFATGLVAALVAGVVTSNARVGSLAFWCALALVWRRRNLGHW